MKLETWIRTEICRIVLMASIFLFLGSPKVNSLECEDDGKCKTGLCNSSGACICNLPLPSSILDGDRLFLGGKFCDEKMTMCDGTNSFWCEHGGTCEEIVQGEKYSCKCPPGYSGRHCEHSGTPCGWIFCFHEAECLAEAEGHVCRCPPDWKGSADCSLQTTSPTDSWLNSTTSTKLSQRRSKNDSNKTLVVLAVCSLAAVAAGGIYAKKLFKKNRTNGVKFQQLSQMRNGGVVDDAEDDENEFMVPQRVHDDAT